MLETVLVNFRDKFVSNSSSDYMEQRISKAEYGRTDNRD